MNLYLINDNNGTASEYGIGTYLHELMKALENTSICVHIVHLRSVRSEFEIEITHQVERWYIPDVRKNYMSSFSIQNMQDYLLNVIYYLRLNIKDKKDLVFHFNFNLSQLFIKELKTKFHCKTVVSVHYLTWMLEFHGNIHKLHALKLKSENQKSPFEKRICKIDQYERNFFKEVDYIIALNHNTRNLLCSEYLINAEKISVIPNGLTNNNAVPVLDKHVLKKKLGISENELIILFIGRLHVAKGIVFLIKAFQKVLEKFADCRLIIVGNGDYDMCVHYAKDIFAKISFTGLLEKKELYELYQIANIGILPSLTEQCSYVVIEMMKNNLPIITTSELGLAEMTENNISSIQLPLIEQLDKIIIDIDFFADRILYLLKNTSDAKRLGDNARKQYEEKYTEKVFHQNMIQFYQNLFI